jgi:hypothetical protein
LVKLSHPRSLSALFQIRPLHLATDTGAREENAMNAGAFRYLRNRKRSYDAGPS